MVIEPVDANLLVYRLDELKNTLSTGEDHSFEAMILESVLKSDCIDAHFIEDATSRHRQDDGCFKSMLPLSSINATDRPIPTSSDLSAGFTNFATSRAPADKPLDVKGLSPSMDDFAKSLWPYLKQASAVIGLDPKLLLAQAALETGWGKSMVKDAEGLSSHNVFNIKSLTKDPAQSIQVNTTEYCDHTPVTVTAAFKSYQSIRESVADYMSLIQGSRRYQEAVVHADSPDQYAEALQAAGYATDPQYARKILSIYHGETLQQVLEHNRLF